ncbi:hypothetical protein [Paenibacillus lactis]|uniref:Response regulator receiver protein n=2 Tax=Paenibacillus lactis TaxID=228574 RepID=G4HHQ4_9BACL|nr:hypothetical protein [Paenibacillus lactis]EHB63630.1 hypothetical protein PaelaDRAFT_3515 [Paenibacillus lactis 154]MBP1891912.1 hypothetical protein [Paenibacillus lactis]HAF99355.1 hypothetical protein [Paenibacillus lactis]
MEKQQDTILISAPTKAGEAFIRQLLLREIPFAVLANNPAEGERASRLGCKDVIMIDTRDEQTWVLPERPIGKVFLFENSLNLCCRYLRICRTWTSASIYVITNSGNPRLIYRGLGADVVLHTNHDRVDFLIAALLD